MATHSAARASSASWWMRMANPTQRRECRSSTAAMQFDFIGGDFGQIPAAGHIRSRRRARKIAAQPVGGLARRLSGRVPPRRRFCGEPHQTLLGHQRRHGVLAHPPAGTPRGRRLDRRIQHRPKACHQRHAQPRRLRAHPSNPTRQGVADQQAPRQERGMTPHRGGYAAVALRAAPRLRGRPSGIKGRYRDRCATGPWPALDPGASTAPDPQRHGQDPDGPLPAQGAALQPRRNPYKPVSTVSGDCPTTSW